MGYDLSGVGHRVKQKKGTLSGPQAFAEAQAYTAARIIKFCRCLLTIKREYPGIKFTGHTLGFELLPLIPKIMI
ncbi:MAG: hypothetical protein HKO68_11320 [Desulfobacterales bacterium]|nr:hypothetical protein [Desulfobacterales bacterium]